MSLVLGYHGCDFKTAQAVLSGEEFIPSEKDYDWLGPGVYFWENDPVRAYQWASDKRRKYAKPSLVGALIDLKKCFDLTTQSAVEALNTAYKSFAALSVKIGKPLPENTNPTHSCPK